MRDFWPVLLICSSLVLSACSNDAAEAEAKKPAISDDNPFKTQVDALDTAKNVEDLLQDTASQRDQQLEDQSR